MVSKSWKQQERRISALYSTIVRTARRIALSGSNNTQGNTSSDTDHHRLYIECKKRKTPPMWGFWTEVLKNAKEEGKVPVLIVQKSGAPTYMAIMELDRHAKFENMIDLYIAGYHDDAMKLLNELSGVGNPNPQVSNVVTQERQTKLEQLVDLIENKQAEEAIKLARELSKQRKKNEPRVL